MKRYLVILLLFFTSEAYSQIAKIDSASFYYNRAVEKNKLEDYNGALQDGLISWRWNCNAQNSEAIFLAAEQAKELLVGLKE